MISSASGFSIGSSDSIDERFVLSKSQMPTINENVYPDVYFAVCKDDGNLYIFNKANDVDTTYGKFRKVGNFSDFEETTTIDKLNNMLVSQSGTWKQISMENVLKGLSVSSLDGNTGLPVSDTGIQNAMGSANGLASLDNSGKLLASQLPTSAREIVGYLDASVDHELPNEESYDNGNEIIITTSGYVLQSTAFTLKAGNKLTNLEVTEANTLIGYSYVFVLMNGESTLGTVATFATDKVTLQDGTEIDLPYASDLSATSTPSTVQVTVNEGDSMMLIDKHWIHLGNTTGVTSVNGKSGAVVLVASDLDAMAKTNPDGTGTISMNKNPSYSQGEYSSILGQNGIASGDYSYTEGYGNKSTGESSHSEGHTTTSSGNYAHTEGFDSTASGLASHAEGAATVASGEDSHAEGLYTIAKGKASHVEGKYNEEDKSNKYAHIVGGGSNNTNRKNIHTLDWNGNAVYAGDVKATDSDGNLVSLIDIQSKDTLTVYVDQENGSDDNDGLTETTPIKELATVLTKYNLSQYFKLFIVIMSDITYTEFTNISISGVSSINIYSYGCSSTYTTDYSKNKKLTNVRFGLSMCRANVNNLDFEGDTYAKADNSLTFYDSSFFRVSMCRFTYTGTSYSDTRGVGIQSSRGDIERCVFTGINYVFYMSYNSDIMVRRNTFDETSEVYITNASVIRYLNVDYSYMLTNGTSNEDSIVYLSDGTIYINKTLIPTSANKETWTFTLSDGSTVTKNVVVL